MLKGLNFIINGKVEISWNDNYYKSNIENVDDASLYISTPIKDGYYINVRNGEQIEVIYYYNNDIYKFYTVIKDKQKDRIPLLVLEHPKEVFKEQRRKFVRIPIVCNIEYFKKENNSSLIPLKAILVDLSGGGMKIKVSEHIELGDKLITHIPLPSEVLVLKGEVVRLERDEAHKKNICGVSFMVMEEQDREKLIKFIFTVMREQMKKSK